MLLRSNGMNKKRIHILIMQIVELDLWGIYADNDNSSYCSCYMIYILHQRFAKLAVIRLTFDSSLANFSWLIMLNKLIIFLRLGVKCCSIAFGFISLSFAQHLSTTDT